MHQVLPFALFVGTAMSVIAFPVLARILTDRGMHRTRIGGIALASAAIDDVLAWSLLAVVAAIADAGGIADYRFIKVLSAVSHGMSTYPRPERMRSGGEFVAVSVLSGASRTRHAPRAARDLQRSLVVCRSA